MNQMSERDKGTNRRRREKRGRALTEREKRGEEEVARWLVKGQV